jgi:CRISPR type III-A-associated RAMP protein Csm4
MRKEFVLQFWFKTPLHISNERADYASGESVIQSDTLLAAVYHSWACLGKASWIEDDALSENPLLMSSMFPFTSLSKEEQVYFFPRPLLMHSKRIVQDEDPVRRKQLKKVQWVDAAVFGAMVHREEQPAATVYGKFQSIYTTLKYPFISSNIIPRVTVSRDNNETTIFYTERYYFSEGCGLYAIVQGSDESIERLQVALRLLQEEGIGTDRNVGNGKFEYTIKEQLPLKPATGDYGISLGLYCPGSHQSLIETVAPDNVRYDLIRRGGWLSEPYGNWRKKGVYMFKPGSCLKLSVLNQNETNLPYMGKLVDVRPTGVSPAIEHPVYRNGRTLFIPVKN